MGVCDVLTAHSYQLQVWDAASFGLLLYTPSPKLQRALLSFVCTHVFVGADGYSQCSGEAYYSCPYSFVALAFRLASKLEVTVVYWQVWRRECIKSPMDKRIILRAFTLKRHNASFAVLCHIGPP